MSRDAWDPAQYAVYSGERSRAFFELTARVRADDPARVADLGCGSGELTATLADRWPGARVLGVDSSANMIGKARAHARPGLDFEVGDLAAWTPAERYDVIVSNAALQWIPAHTALFARWLDVLAPGGVLAFQVPGNQAAPSHTVVRGLCAEYGLDPGLVPGAEVLDPGGYLEILAGLGCAVDAWETTYSQLLSGPDPVLEWVKGTALRPVLAALDDPGDFLAACAAGLRAAYPETGPGTVFPFRRVFVVARAP